MNGGSQEKTSFHSSLNVDDRLPLLFLPGISSEAASQPFSRRRRPLIAFPRAATLSESEIPWVGLYQSLDLRMGRILDSLDRLSRGEPLRLPRVVPVRLSESALTFYASEPFNPGTKGGLILELPTLPACEIDCDLSVVHCVPWDRAEDSPPEEGYAVTGLFGNLEGEMRESLLQYLVLRQREILAFKGK
ncbi:MAG: hypothetical protein M1537_04730 [Nitrospirae bacterium]|nr:hypothetical protein [Nitrospirota bacterium]